MPISFVHLRLHTEFSLHDGLIRLKPLVNQAAELGYPALPLTDDSNLFALVKFYQGTQAKGIKPIIGCDLWLEPPTPNDPPARITLLASNALGYRNLTEIITQAWLEGQHLGRPLIKFDWLTQRAEGLIALSGAKDGPIGQQILADDFNQALELTRQFMACFPQAFYLEVQRTGRRGDEECLHASVSIGQQLNCPLVATNDVRFMQREDFWAHETRVAISQGRPLDAIKNTGYSPEQYLKSPAEMQELFADLPSALANSVEIAKRCNLDVRLGEYFLPHLDIEDGLTEAEYFRKQAHEGLTKRLEKLYSPPPANFAEIEQTYRERLDFELTTIIDMGFPSYFLIVADFINWALDNGVPVGPGRGSGAGSLVAYSLNITDLDPLEYSLLFERFLNPERVSMPDFDIDFCMEGREKVIDYVTQTYGREAVSQIVTFGTMAAKGVVRDVARAQGKAYAVGERLAKAIPFEVGMTLEKAAAVEDSLAILENAYQLSLEGELTEQQLEGISAEDLEVWMMARQLEGIARNTGKHAGGVVIAPSTLTEFAPVMTDEEGHGRVVQFDKDDIENAGLVKFDFLGLRTLTIIDWALKDINAKRKLVGEPPLDISAIPLNDQRTFALLQKAETTAVFQLESDGMKELIKKLKPDSLEDMIALVALYRPGPLQSGMVDDFIQRKHGKAPIAYPHTDFQDISLKPVLEPTYGIILYQEQVMQIAQVMAGFTLGGADMLRRAMGKKQPEEMAKMRQMFMDGSKDNGIDAIKAGHIFDLVEKFAGYGFNKSHSAAYGLVSYQTAWLKTHYPASFMAAVLSSEMQNTDKIVMLVEEARKMGLTLSSPNANQGQWHFSVTNEGEILYGLGAIKGVGEGPVEALTEARKQGGKFTDLFDFCQRVDLKRLNKRSLDALIRSGALDELAPAGRHLLMAALDEAIRTADQARRNTSLGIDDLFGSLETSSTNANQDPYANYRNTPEWTKKLLLAGEKETLGLYLSGHPIDDYEEELKLFGCKKISLLQAGKDTQRFAGLLMDIRTLRTKRGENLAVLTLDDKSARIEVTVFSDEFQEHRDNLKKDSLVIIDGEVREDTYRNTIAVRCKDLTPLDQARGKFARALAINLEESSLNSAKIQQLHACLTPYIHPELGLKLEFIFTGQQAQATLTAGNKWLIQPQEQLLDELHTLLGRNNFRLVYSQ